MDGHHRRLPHCAAGRHQCADWRAGRGVHRHRLRHRRALWRGQPADFYGLCGGAAVPARDVQAGQPGALRAGEHRHRLHQRHCGADRAVAGEGLAGAVHRQDAGQLFLAGSCAGPAHRHAEPLCAGAGRAVPGRPVPVAAPVHARLAGAAHCRGPHRALFCTRACARGGPDHPDRAGLCDGLPSGDDWLALWRHSAAGASVCVARFFVGHRAPAGHAHRHHCATGRHRVAAVCARSRPAGHQPAPQEARPQPGAHGPGRCQFHRAVLWGHARYRHHCAHRDQPARGRHQPHRRHRARCHAGAHRAAGRAAGPAHPAGGAGGHPALCGLEHGRVARVCAPQAFQQPLPAAHAGHVLPDRGV